MNVVHRYGTRRPTCGTRKRVSTRPLAESGSDADLLTTAATRISALADDEPDQLDAAKQGMRNTKPPGFGALLFCVL
jgi:hypothetical protein